MTEDVLHFGIAGDKFWGPQYFTKDSRYLSMVSSFIFIGSMNAALHTVMMIREN